MRFPPVTRTERLNGITLSIAVVVLETHRYDPPKVRRPTTDSGVHDLTVGSPQKGLPAHPAAQHDPIGLAGGEFRARETLVPHTIG